jgi:putative ABC transport system ATP-binding protein
MAETSIQCRGIRKSYGDGEGKIDALKGIDLDIYAGQLTLLVGPSGSGKTSLLSIITTILTPDTGELLLLGKNPFHMPDRERSKFCNQNLGIIFQSLYLIPTLTVAENVALPLLINGDSPTLSNEKSLHMLNQVNMGHRSDASPDCLSKGQQQKVAIARAIVTHPKILVCDEPTSALDHAAGIEIMSILRDLALHSAKAVLVVTHDHRIFSFADRIIHLSDGEIVPGDTNE